MSGAFVDPSAWRRVVNGVRRIEGQPRKLHRERRRRPIPLGGGTGGGTLHTDPCVCGGCVPGGFVTTCPEFPEAPTEYSLHLLGHPLEAVFGPFVLLVHDVDCIWVSDVFENVNLNGDPNRDYFFKLDFSAGTGIEDVVLTLEDDT